MDPIAKFKEQQKAAWANFTALENVSGTAAPRLVRFAGIGAGDRVLDVACGTGVVGLTAARSGAKVTGIDLTPELIARARENAALMGSDSTFHEGDAEELPFPDASFDVVVSQFGHMFAPRPAVVVQEMLRVLKVGGTIAFTTWPPELFTGKLFALLGRYNPPPPPGIVSPILWGDPAVIRERLGSGVGNLQFTRDVLFFQILSVPHYCQYMERNPGPMARLLQNLEASDPSRAAEFRRDLAATVQPYFENNAIRQDYLLSRAVRE
jgi:SAM-dependent methyltransferase